MPGILDKIKNFSAPGSKKSSAAKITAQKHEGAAQPESTTQAESTPQAESTTQAESTPQAEQNHEVVQAQQTEQAPQAQPSSEKPKKQRLSRAEIIEKQHKRFKLISKIILFTLIIGVVAFAIFFVSKRLYILNKDRLRLNPDDNTKPGTALIIHDDGDNPEEEKNKVYKNDVYRFSVSYPKEDFISIEDYEETNRDYFVQIKCSENEPLSTNSGFELLNGYMININPLLISIRSTEDVTYLKRSWYEQNCPERTTVNLVEEVEFDGLRGFSFLVENCHSNYKVYYVRANQYIYEIIQIYKGDLGFEQINKNKSADIIRSIKIDRDGPPDPDPFVFYNKASYGLSFSYPSNLDVTCCNAIPPPGEKVATLLTLSTGDNEHVAGFFTESRISELDENGFYNYVDSRQQLLIDDYTVIKGVPPQGTKEKIKIDDQPGIVLDGYSWKGNKLIYIYLPRIQRALIISTTGFPEDTLDDILDSMEIKY